MATSIPPTGSGAPFDAVVAKDKVVKGDSLGEFKLRLNGLQKSDPAGAIFENGFVRAWCTVRGQRHSFSYKFPPGAIIQADSVSVPETERKNNVLKVYFKKTSNFMLKDIYQQ